MESPPSAVRKVWCPPTAPAVIIWLGRDRPTSKQLHQGVEQWYLSFVYVSAQTPRGTVAVSSTRSVIPCRYAWTTLKLTPFVCRPLFVKATLPLLTLKVSAADLPWTLNWAFKEANTNCPAVLKFYIIACTKAYKTRGTQAPPLLFQPLLSYSAPRHQFFGALPAARHDESLTATRPPLCDG